MLGLLFSQLISYDHTITKSLRVEGIKKSSLSLLKIVKVVSANMLFKNWFLLGVKIF